MSQIAHIRQNTDKFYPCVNCGSAGNIIREGADPRLKCNSCGFLYDGSASIEAQEKGQIPDGAPLIQAPEPVPTRQEEERSTERPSTGRIHRDDKIPRSPSYVFLSKDRTRSEFATKKSIRSVALRWEYEGVTYDVYELQAKKVEAKLSIE